ncbi:Protein MULTIPOLAR SPINDLE 1, partial [Linum grandiflorum]
LVNSWRQRGLGKEKRTGRGSKVRATDFPPDVPTIPSMATSNPKSQDVTTTSSRDESLKLAVAISLLRSKLLHSQQPPPPPSEPSSVSDALRWKRKAKDRKQEIIRLREDLKEAQDASSMCDLFPQTAACKCYLFDDLGQLRPEYARDGSNSRFKDVLRRRFFRQDLNSEDEVEQFRASVDFLVELCDGIASPMEEAHFANWSHQAVDFILESLSKILPLREKMELTEGIVSSLVMRLLRRMCSPSHRQDASHVGINYQCQVQHLLRKLGSECFIGQRTLVLVCERVYTIAENLLFMDPFDEAFPNIHQSLYIMIQLLEFLILEYLPAWLSAQDFDYVVLEEWVTWFLHARKALQLMESRHGLYALYMDRVANELAKQVCQVSSLHKLNQQLLLDLSN